MPSRIELEQRARVLGITPANYPNDSKLEQRIIYAEKNAATATGTQASGTLTSTGTEASNGDQFLLGPNTYTLVTTLTEALASQTLTGSNAANATNGSWVTIGTVTYTLVTTLGAAQNQVLIGTTADNTLTNLVDAITGGGTAGTNYSNGTVTNTQVTASGPTSHVVTITALTVGTFSNGITISTTEPTYTFGGTNLAGGVNPVPNQVVLSATVATQLANIKAAINGASGAGTTYSTGTIANPVAAAGTVSGDNLPVTATVPASDMSISTTIPTGSQFSWGATTLQSNVAAVIVAPTASANGQEGGALV